MELNLFSKISYSINSTEIDSNDNPGITTTLKGLSSFSNCLGLNNADLQLPFIAISLNLIEVTLQENCNDIVLRS